MTSNKSCRSDNSRKRPHIHRFRTVARRICVRKFAQRTDTDANKSCRLGNSRKRPHNRLDRTAAHRKWVHTSASTLRPSTPQLTTPPHTVSQNAISFRSSFSSPVPFAQHNRFARCAKTTRFRTILPTCNQLLSPYHLSVVSLVYSMIKSRAS